jgi:quercetin dioxygenase-like cupin family protein
MRILASLSVLAMIAAELLLSQNSVTSQMPKDEPMVTWLNDIKFEHLPFLPDCLTIFVEHGNPETGPSEVLAKMSPGCVVPWHWHGPNESLIVVEGAVENQTRGENPYVMHKGDFAYLPTHHQHRGMCRGPEACMTFLYSDAQADVHWVDEAGKEISVTDAQKLDKSKDSASGSKP